MASRTSNFCIDAHDPVAQARWWAQLLDDFMLPSEDDQQEWDDECWRVGPDDREIVFLNRQETGT